MAQNEQLSDEEKLSNFLSAMADSIMEMPADELAEEIRAEGGDPEELLQSANNVISRVIKDYRLRDLYAARVRYDRRVTEYYAEQSLPGTSETRRAALAAILASASDSKIGHITAQFRSLKEMSDEDVDSCYRQLLLLGVITPDAPEPEEMEGNES